MWQRRHLALQGRVSCRDPAVPVRGSDAAAAAGWRFHPMTHGCKKQRSGVTTQDRRAPPARATNPRTGGHRPKKTAPCDRYEVALEMVRQLNAVDACPSLLAASRAARELTGVEGFKPPTWDARMVCDLPHMMLTSTSQEPSVVGNTKLHRVLSASSVAG